MVSSARRCQLAGPAVVAELVGAAPVVAGNAPAVVVAVEAGVQAAASKANPAAHPAGRILKLDPRSSRLPGPWQLTLRPEKGRDDKMTDPGSPGGTPPPPPPPEGAASPGSQAMADAKASIDKVTAGMSAGARLMGLGALIILGGYVVFELIMREYSTGPTCVLLSVWILIVAMARQRGSAGADTGLASNTWLRVIGYSLAIVGVYFLLSELRAGSLDEFADVIGAIVLYGGIVVVFLGTRALPKTA
jgi:hypothetical protein